MHHPTLQNRVALWWTHYGLYGRHSKVHRCYPEWARLIFGNPNNTGSTTVISGWTRNAKDGTKWINNLIMFEWGKKIFPRQNVPMEVILFIKYIWVECSAAIGNISYRVDWSSCGREIVRLRCLNHRFRRKHIRVRAEREYFHDEQRKHWTTFIWAKRKNYRPL